MKIKSGFNFDEKYDLYSSMIYKICVTYLGNKYDAEDAINNNRRVKVIWKMFNTVLDMIYGYFVWSRRTGQPIFPAIRI